MKGNRGLSVIMLIILMFASIGLSTMSYGQKDMRFTKEEQVFIAEHPIITIGVDPEFMPYEFIDDEGHYLGIASDYIAYIEEVSGLKFELVENLKWKEAYNLAVAGEIDVLPCVSETATRKELFLFSDAYYNFQRVIVVDENNEEIKSQEDLRNQVIAVQENSSHHSYLVNNTPYEFNTYETVEAALQAVSRGDEVAFIGNLATTQYVVNNLGVTKLKYYEFHSETVSGLHFAINKDMPLLQGIINKSLDMMTVEDRTTIHNKWIGMEKKTDYSHVIRTIIYVLVVAGLVIVISFYWILKLRKEIQKRNEIEAALIEARQEAETSNYIKSTFLARMSHEIRTPLNGITGMCFLLGNTDLDYKQEAHLERIKEASGTMLSIINDILDFSKVEAGKIEIEAIPFELDGLIKNVLNIVSFKIEEKKLGFNLRQKPDMSNSFIGDPKRIEQVLMNVINNAVKFTSQGGVSLSIDSIYDENQVHHIEFRVKDTGIGVEASRIDNLFEAFTQEDSSITRRFGGTGLGLSITKNIVELMAGTIEVESELGVGTEFIIKIPLEIDPAYKNKELSHELIFSGTKAIILDESGIQLRLVHSYLNSFGIQAELTTSLDELIRQLESADANGEPPYDLILVDYETPMNGVEALYKAVEESMLIKNQPKWLIMLPFLRDDLSLEFDGNHISITKPIFPSVLLDALLHLFDPESFAQEREQYIKEEKLVDLSQDQYKILIVEDNKTNQLIAKSLLGEIGVGADVVDDGQQGLDHYRQHQADYDLILMDLHMPIMDGYEATKEIRIFDKTIPIMALTADAITGVEEKCRTYGFTHFMSKPFVPEEFAKIIGGILSESREAINDGSHYDVADEEIWNQALGLKMLGGNEKLFNEVLNVYLAENVQTLDELSYYVNNKAYDQAAKLVHKVKSSTGSIGSEGVRQLAAELQHAFETSDQEQIDMFYSRFIGQFERLIKIIENR